MQWREPNIVESDVGANSSRVQMGSKMYDSNTLKKYIAREPDVEVNVIPTNEDDGATVAVARVMLTQNWGKYQI